MGGVTRGESVPGLVPGRRPDGTVHAVPAGPAWELLDGPRREHPWIRLRRGVVVIAAAIVVLTGVVTITGQVLAWLAPQAPPTRAAAVSERDFDAVAVPFAVDYLSWDETARGSRQAALARSAAPDTTVDGWTGEGRQWADSATAIGIARADNRAVVTVRVRVTPYSPAEGTGTDTSGSTAEAPEQDPESNATHDGGHDNAEDGVNGTGGGAGPSSAPSGTAAEVPNVASGLVPGTSDGWVAGPPRWLNLAVSVIYRDGRVVVTARPALVGSPQSSALPPAVPDSSAEEDGAFARSTRATVTTLLRAYGSGELTYARGQGTSFTGLNNAATVEAITQWRVQKLSDTTNDSGSTSNGDGADGTVRAGEVTVTWALSGDAGTLTCTYRVELYRDGGRWYLASIGAVMAAVI